MPERYTPALKIVCLGLAALMVAQMARLAARKDPLEQLSFSALAILPADAEKEAGTKDTNSVPPARATKQDAAPAPIMVSVEFGPNSSNLIAMGQKGTKIRPPLPASSGGSMTTDVPPAVQTRIDHIVQSEILGPVLRPLPMALLGIAGHDAFLRAPNGQTGLLREGEELGGVKLLRIGTNRVLVEHEQQQKELTVFSGFGSETLLPKGKANRQ